MGKMLSEQVESNIDNNNNNQHKDIINDQQINNNKTPITNQQQSTATSIYYLYSQPAINLLSGSLQLFNLYKKFAQNTIMELGQDWRIQSSLLAQEIINQKNLTNDQFCIFNQFMAGFLRAKIIEKQAEHQNNHHISHNHNVNVNMNKSHHHQHQTQSQQQQQQYEFLKYFCRTLPYITNKQLNNINSIEQQQQHQSEFSNNLTFKTLSLGFYITAGDIWMRMFKKYHKIIEVQQGIKRIHIDNSQQSGSSNSINSNNNNRNVVYFGTLNSNQQQWTIQPQVQIQQLLAPYQSLLLTNNNNHINNVKTHQQQSNIKKAIKLGSVVINIQQTIINNNNKNRNNNSQNNNSQNNNNPIITIHTFNLCRQFYQQLFLVWLVCNIKKSFNSTLFPSSCFIRYCDIIIGTRIFKQQNNQNNNYHQNNNNHQNNNQNNNNNQSQRQQLTRFHSIYHQFKLLCDNQWKKLMKDYMIALNDDKQVLGVLVKRIEEQLITRFIKQIQGKQNQINKINNSN